MIQKALRKNWWTEKISVSDSEYRLKRIELFGTSGSGKSTIYNKLPCERLGVDKFHDLKMAVAMNYIENKFPFSSFNLGNAQLRKGLGSLVVRKSVQWMDKRVEKMCDDGPFQFPYSLFLPEQQYLIQCRKRKSILKRIAWFEYIQRINYKGMMLMDEGLVMASEEECLRYLPLTGLTAVVHLHCDFCDWYERMRVRRYSGQVKGAKNIYKYSRQELSARFERRRAIEDRKCDYLYSVGIPVLSLSTSDRAERCINKVTEFVYQIRLTYVL